MSTKVYVFFGPDQKQKKGTTRLGTLMLYAYTTLKSERRNLLLPMSSKICLRRSTIA